MATLLPPVRLQLSAASDARLVDLARDGDDDAFEAIVDRYAPLLLRRARRIVGDEAQDAVQHAFISAWNALRGGCDVRDLRPWLCTIAHRAALQTLHERSERAAELPDSLASHCSPVDQFEQSARTRTIFSAIAKLPASEQHALVSTSLLGISGRVTANTLGVSEGAVRQLVFRARTRLRTAVHVFVPPVAVIRLWGKWAHGARRVTALGDGASHASSSSESVGMFVKLGATVAAGLAIGAPVVIFNRDHDHAGHRHTQAAPGAISHRATTSAPKRGSLGARRAHPSNGSGPAGRLAEPTAVKQSRSAAAPSAPGAVPDGSTGSVTAVRDAPREAASQTHEDPSLPVASQRGTGAAPPTAGQIVSEAKGGQGQVPPVVHQALPVVTEAVQGVQSVVHEAGGTVASAGEAVVGDAKGVLQAPSKVLQTVAPIVHLR